MTGFIFCIMWLITIFLVIIKFLCLLRIVIYKPGIIIHSILWIILITIVKPQSVFFVERTEQKFFEKHETPKIKHNCDYIVFIFKLYKLTKDRVHLIVFFKLYIYKIFIYIKVRFIDEWFKKSFIYYLK